MSTTKTTTNSSHKRRVRAGVVAVAALGRASAFAPPAFHVVSPTRTVGDDRAVGISYVERSASAHRPRMAADENADDEVAALRAAAAKYREESARLAKELGKDVPAEAEKKASSAATAEPRDVAQVFAATSAIDFAGGDASSQTTALNDLVAAGELSLWRSAASSPTSTTSGTLRTFPVTQATLESRSNGAVTAASLGIASDGGGGDGEVTLDDLKDATIVVAGVSFAAAIASLALLPENVGAGLSYLFALIPVLYLGVGSTAPGLIAGAINAVRGVGADADDTAAALDRVCRHEAGHFLCGYLCGLPVRSYEVTDGVPRVEFHPCADGVSGVATAPPRELERDEIAALAVVALSGSVAEAVGLGQARGGRNDLVELDGLFRRSKEFLGAAAQQNMTRWGALVAYQLIRANNDRYERLVTAFKEQKSVAECIAVLEATS